MANEKTKAAVDKNIPAASAAPNYMPEGYSDDDFAVVGGFVPMYKPDNVWSKESNKAKPGVTAVFGWGAHIDPLSEIAAKKDEAARTPLVANIILCAPNQGVLGKRGEEKIVQCAVGERILVPIGGNLLWNKPFIEKLFDPKHYWLMRIQVIGTQPSDYPADTWMWQVEIAKKPKLRSEHPELANAVTALHPAIIEKLEPKVRKALPMTAYMKDVPILGQYLGTTTSGEVYDKMTGEAKRLVGPNGQASV